MRKVLILTFFLSVLMSVYAIADIEYKCVEDNIKINYLGESEKSYDIIYCNGRLFVPFEEVCSDFNINIKPLASRNYLLSKDKQQIEISSSTGKSNKTDMYFYNNKAYVYIYKLIEPFGDMPVINSKQNTVYVLKNINDNLKPIKTKSSYKKLAYIRLEDIVADGLDKSLTPKYDESMLEELRYTAQYLFESGQSYYVAWIPVYANPKQNYWNDVSQSYNLYNSYFVYTLDFMAEHNGHIGLHGYTHQYGDTISADGFEWGSNTPYSLTEQENRMIKAIKVGDRLGLNIVFFEFPHYGATDAQLKLAQKYFNLIYQSYPTKKTQFNFSYTAQSGKKVYFMPTPADYVHTKYDVGNTISRLSLCMKNNYAVSLFYHPIIDKDYIHENTNKGKRIWEYNDGALPKILQYISDNGYIFAPIPID